MVYLSRLIYHTGIKMVKRIIKSSIPWLEVEGKIYKLYKKSHQKWLNGQRFIAKHYEYKIYRKYGCQISCKAEIGENLKLPHPVGIVIGEGVKIGENCIIYQNVTLGRKNRDIAEYPEIGNGVIVYCNSCVLGNIKIGNNCVIGCNSVVLNDVSENSIVKGVYK